MRMNCDSLNQHLPYEILWRTRDIAMKWGTWRVHAKFATPIAQRDAYHQLVSTNVIQYIMHDNEGVERLADRANELRAQEQHKPAKVDETDIAGALVDPSISGSFKESAGVDPDDGVVSFAGGAFHVCDFDIPNVMVEVGKIRDDRYAVGNGTYPPNPYWIEL